MIFLVVFFLLLGASVEAQSLPDRYFVTGVASDDVLNIREQPDASTGVIGEFKPDTQNVEVLREQDGWGYTGAGERSGWVSMRFLAPSSPPLDGVPRPLACYGTEPFWNVSFDDSGTEYNALGEGPRVLTILREDVAPNGFIFDTKETSDTYRTFLVTALPCNDGMSDRDFGMSVSMFTTAPNSNSVQTGCCTFQVN